MPKLTKLLKATAIHEAGHGVAAYNFNLRWRHITIEPDHESNSLGHLLHAAPKNFHPDSDSSDRTRRIIEAHCICSFAGGVAEAKYKGHSKNLGAMSDYRSIVDLAGCVSPIGGAELDAYLKWLWLRTKNFVATPHHWLAIEYLANALLQHRTLEYKECFAIIKEAYHWLPEAWITATDGDGTVQRIHTGAPPLDLSWLHSAMSSSV